MQAEQLKVAHWIMCIVPTVGPDGTTHSAGQQFKVTEENLAHYQTNAKKYRPVGLKKTSFWKDRCAARKHETIGGGFILIKVGSGSGRLRPAIIPFELDSLEAAEKAKERLATPDSISRFEIWRRA